MLLILLLTLVVEFGASTLLYERSSSFSVREDEAHRLAEHLVIARKLISERPAAERAAAAAELVTDRYHVGWSTSPPRRSNYPRLPSTERQILAWESGLARSDLRVRLAPLSQGSAISGEFRLRDGSWVDFRTRDIHRGWSLAFERVLIALLPAVLLALVGGLLIRTTLLPLRRLIGAIGRVGSGEPVHVAEEGTAEIRGLIHAFNGMQERIHELIDSRTQALAAVGHDLRTPLARLQLRLESVRDRDNRTAMAGDIAEMEDMIESLLTFLRGEDDPEIAVPIDLAVMLDTLVGNAADAGHDAHYAGPGHVELVARPSLLRRALANLIENAIHYGHRARVSLTAGPDEVTILVADDGPGIAPERVEAALRPFVRLDDARGRNTKGLGLGLAIVSLAVTREGGRLTLSNRRGGGLDAAITLPRRQQ